MSLTMYQQMYDDHERLVQLGKTLEEVTVLFNDLMGRARPEPLLPILHRVAPLCDAIVMTCGGEPVAAVWRERVNIEEFIDPKDVDDYDCEEFDNPFGMADKAFSHRLDCDEIVYRFHWRVGDTLSSNFLLYTACNEGIERIVDWSYNDTGPNNVAELIEEVSREYQEDC